MMAWSGSLQGKGLWSSLVQVKSLRGLQWIQTVLTPERCSVQVKLHELTRYILRQGQGQIKIRNRAKQVSNLEDLHLSRGSSASWLCDLGETAYLS